MRGTSPPTVSQSHPNGELSSRGSAAELTKTGVSETQFTAVIEQLAAQSESLIPKVLVASIPNLYRVWEVGHVNASMVAGWEVRHLPVCWPSPPESEHPGDVAARAQVTRVEDYNALLSGVCGSDAYKSFCKYGGGAVIDYGFALEHLSTWDCVNPTSTDRPNWPGVTWQGGLLADDELSIGSCSASGVTRYARPHRATCR
jgi:hypothetical protein